MIQNTPICAIDANAIPLEILHPKYGSNSMITIHPSIPKNIQDKYDYLISSNAISNQLQEDSLVNQENVPSPKEIDKEEILTLYS